MSQFADVAADDVELTEKVTLTRHFKDKVVQPILKVSLLCFTTAWCKFNSGSCNEQVACLISG